MGEQADMIFEGIICQGCGEFINDGKEPGYCKNYNPVKPQFNYQKLMKKRKKKKFEN